jgi:glucosamine--fructose-6-phosphate aminotransferase (isomerizing)
VASSPERKRTPLPIETASPLAGKLVAADIGEQPDVLGRVIAANKQALEEARELIDRANLVRLIGIGSSKHSAGYAAQVLEVLAEKPAVVMPAPGAAVVYPRFGRDQVVFVLSQSGETPALLEAAAAATKAGAPVIAVTNTPGSSLEAVAELTLTCAAGAERVVAATKSVTAQMVILRAVARPLSSSEVEDLTGAARQTIEMPGLSTAVIGNPPGSVICGGFAGEWVADEIALKFAEMAGRPVVSESIVEYFHGPAGAASPTLAFLDPADPNSSELVGTDGVVTVGPHESFHVRTAGLEDKTLDALLRLIAGQMIVLEWARELGENPDSDRGLSKVTQTL